VHSNGPLNPLGVSGAANVGVPEGCTVAGYTLLGQGYGILQLVPSVSQTVTKTFQVTCPSSGLNEVTGCAVSQISQLHVRDDDRSNGFGTDRDVTLVGNPIPNNELLNTAGRCSTLDPLEECGDGIDNDADTQVDEEPDADLDGVSDCVDADDDGDGYSDVLEAFMGTDPLAPCPILIGYHAAWPPDMDNSQDVSITDVLALKPVFGSVQGGATYDSRQDLDASNGIDVSDVLALKPTFGLSCQ